MKNNGNTFYSIEGNIGSGKSFLINKLKKLNDNKLILIQEPIDEWLNYKISNEDKSLFELFYNDMKKYSFHFENVVMNIFFKQLITINNKYKNKIIIFERSIFTVKNIFIKQLFIDNNLNKIELKILFDNFSLFYKMLLPNFKYNYIFLKCPINILQNRINKRSRVSEDKISQEYLINLDKRHNEWLNKHNDCIIIDSSKSLNVKSIYSIF